MSDSVAPTSRANEAVAADENGDAGQQRSRSAVQIEADLEATAQRLSANVDALVERLSPAHIAKGSVKSARGLIMTESGRPRPELIGAVAGALVGAAVLLWWRNLR